MVMPRSRSSSMESSTCASISRSASPPHNWMKRSASVDLPWSMWAMMEKLRICCMEKGTRQCPSVGVKPRILSEFREIRSNVREFEPVMAEFAPLMHQYRHAFAVTAFQFRVGIDVDDHDFETKMAL